jgi:hypothetical protein
MTPNCGHKRAYCSYPRLHMSTDSHGGMILTGKKTPRKTCPSVTLSITNPIWTDPDANPGLCDERPATNCLSHDMAWFKAYSGGHTHTQMDTMMP